MPYTQRDLQALENYLNQQISAGYDIKTLRTFLIKQGYAQDLVDQSISSISGANQNRKINLKFNLQSKYIFGSIAIVAIVILLIFVMPKLFHQEEVKQTPTSPNKGLIGTELDKSSSNTAKTAVVTKNIPETKKIDIQKPNVQNEENNVVPPTNTVNNNDESDKDSILQIQTKLDDTDEQTGKNICEDLKEDQKINSCYKKLALKYNNKVYCRSIVSQSLKDDCFIVFAFAGDLDACTEIQNQYHLLTCRSLGQRSTYEEGV